MGNKNGTPLKTASEDILYGVNPVTEALKAGRRRIYELFLAGEKASDRISGLADLAGSLNIPLTRMDGLELSRIAGTDSHQNVAARVSAYPFSGISDILAKRHKEGAPFILILDGVEDPQNLGALARTALGAGVDGIIIPKDRAALPTPSASKASAGALEHIHLVRETNLVNIIKDLKKEGFWITGLDAEAKTSLYEGDFSSATALVVGGEGRGLRDLVKKHCDYLVFIPQKGPLSSLNASVAGALSMYEVVRQRQKQ
ncbi:MAG: 23S rRNA (guanosine(2251)-2'-O)-methyltransferase RlmB [Proteobacteria bacterium]|nr:23S rRNA (guanosine(2251)-2'-O)-methyltransferase RlmB [Pseudomonadota bacterium]